MKTIGFIDYYISEWHANNYPAWIKEASEEMGEDFVVKYAWAELDKSLVDGVTTDEWCEKMGVEKCATIQEVCEKADYLLVLAPSNPETHLRYAQEVLKYKKNTYIDKTFAPDYETAKKIFDIAAQYGTKFFSSSALRYGSELDDLKDIEHVVTTGGGGNMPEYIIHQTEMVVKLLNAKPTKVRVEAQGQKQNVCSVEFEGGKKATMVYSNSYGFAINAQRADGTSENRAITSNTFNRLIRDILRFYLTGETSFDVNQTLDVMKIRGSVVRGLNALGEWKEVE